MQCNQLVNEVKIGENQTMGVYKLTDGQAKKYAGGLKYFLSSGIFSDYAFKHMSDDELLGNIKPQYYEGFFETEREAYLQAMLIRADTIICCIRNTLDELPNMKNGFDWDVEYKKEKGK